jgi:hypothetical protein
MDSMQIAASLQVVMAQVRVVACSHTFYDYFTELEGGLQQDVKLELSELADIPVEVAEVSAELTEVLGVLLKFHVYQDMLGDF